MAKQKIEIELYWPEDKGIVACAVRRVVPNNARNYCGLLLLCEEHVEAYAEALDWEVIMRPKPEPKYKVFYDRSRWAVSEKSAYELARAHFYGKVSPNLGREAVQVATLALKIYVMAEARRALAASKEAEPRAS